MAFANGVFVQQRAKSLRPLAMTFVFGFAFMTLPIEFGETDGPNGWTFGMSLTLATAKAAIIRLDRHEKQAMAMP